MKKLIFAAAVAFLGCSLFVGIQPAYSALSSFTAYKDQQWTNTNSSQLTISFSNFNHNISFGVYDLNDDTDKMRLINPSREVQTLISWDGTENQWLMENETQQNNPSFGGDPEDTWIHLGNQDLDQALWGFYFYDSDTDTTYYSYEAEELGTDYWALTFEFDADTVLTAKMHDIKPVPVPTAALLLGSGIIGLLGFRRRNANR